MEKRSKDELILIALHLELPELLRFCNTNKIINDKVCKNADVWRRVVLRDFPGFKFESLNSELRELFPKEIYTLLYTIRVWKLDIDVNQLYSEQNLKSDKKDITVIPENLHLPNLKTLMLRDNQIRTIPESLNLPNLRELYLSGNKITKIPQNLYLPKLHSLYLDNNQIRTIPQNLDNMPKLGYLFLSRNLIQEIPENLSLPKLNTLYIHTNKLKSISEDLYLPKLKAIVLRGNKIKKIPKKFKKLINPRL